MHRESRAGDRICVSKRREGTPGDNCAETAVKNLCADAVHDSLLDDLRSTNSLRLMHIDPVLTRRGSVMAGGDAARAINKKTIRKPGNIRIARLKPARPVLLISEEYSQMVE